MHQLNPTKKPLIGILANLMVMEGGPFPGLERTYVNHDYVTSILKAQGTPFLLPVIPDEEMIRQQIDCVDAILISGGYDVHPIFYGEEPSQRLEFIYPERDEYEIKAIKYAAEQKKPILGICRGLQVMNVAFGGSLHQDISHQQDFFQHSQKAHRHVPSHTIDLVTGSQLHQIFKQDQLMTNSFHHQAIKALAPGFIVSGRTRDGIIEGIERKNEFVIGVQWHPEAMVEKHPIMLKLFEVFVAEAQACRDRLT